ncbi:hypothetical protein CC79DRAFT_1401094 [Sarocladium strictum]
MSPTVSGAWQAVSSACTSISKLSKRNCLTPFHESTVGTRASCLGTRMWRLEHCVSFQVVVRIDAPYRVSSLGRSRHIARLAADRDVRVRIASVVCKVKASHRLGRLSSQPRAIAMSSRDEQDPVGHIARHPGQNAYWCSSSGSVDGCFERF